MNPNEPPENDEPSQNDDPSQNIETQEKDAVKELPVDFERDESVDRAVTRAVREDLARHALKGNLVVVWQDGRPALVPAPTPEPTS